MVIESFSNLYFLNNTTSIDLSQTYNLTLLTAILKNITCKIILSLQPRLT